MIAREVALLGGVVLRTLGLFGHRQRKQDARFLHETTVRKDTRSMIVQLEKTFRFEAAHFLPKVPEGHKCRKIHGHSFVVDVTIEGEVDPEMGWLMDFAEILDVWKPIYEQLDHQLLNDIEGLENPTSELLAHWLWQRMKPELPGLIEIVVNETCLSRCRYKGQ